MYVLSTNLWKPRGNVFKISNIFLVGEIDHFPNSFSSKRTHLFQNNTQLLVSHMCFNDLTLSGGKNNIYSYNQPIDIQLGSSNKSN